MKYKSLFEQAENGNHYSTINAKLVKSGCKTPVIKFTLQYPNIFWQITVPEKYLSYREALFKRHCSKIIGTKWQKEKHSLK